MGSKRRPAREEHRMRRKAFAAIATAAIVVLMMMPGTALATHNNRIPDFSDPNSTRGPNGNNCSADAITPSPASSYTMTYGDYAYRLRYSANCRSVWGRSLNSAPRRSAMHTHRHSDGALTGSCCITGDTYAWTRQLDDAGHLSNLHLGNPAYDSTALF
jgi:hypothetical protein